MTSGRTIGGDALVRPGSMFACPGMGLLRAPVHAVPRVREIPAEIPADAAGLARCLRSLIADGLVREAVAVSSPSLAAALESATSGDRRRVARPAALRRAARALLSYRLRMATRATPFGLVAGVAPVAFVDRPDAASVWWGRDHRRGVRPDREWLTGLVADWETRPTVLPHLRVVVNDLCFVRGGRLVLPYVPGGGGASSGASVVQEVSVRLTSAVLTVVELADRPVPAAVLIEALRSRFSGAPRDSIDLMLCQLVSTELLLTDARPPLEATDPLGHVLAAFARVPETDLPELAELRWVRDALEVYTAQPIGRGRAVHAAVCHRMRQLRAADHVVHVDLALDARVSLPRAVADEAARAADLLWRLAPRQQGPDFLRDYLAAFLERYGTARFVPLKELLDPDIGLGAPAGYRRPTSHRTLSSPRAEDPTRDRLLAELAESALLAGDTEVVLDDDHPIVARLTGEYDEPPTSLDMCAQVLSESLEELTAGRFRLVLAGGSWQATATMARFSYLLPDLFGERLAGLARTTGATESDALNPQVSFQSGWSHDANVAQVPWWLDRVLPVAVFADRDDPAVLSVDQLAVGCDGERLVLVDTVSGRRVRPSVFHMLTPEWQAPNVARFVSDLAAGGVRGWQCWSWGAADTLPHLPRVRYGRTILARAHWRPGDVLRDRSMPYPAWRAELDTWRRRWRVPRRVRVGNADRTLELDLDTPSHLAVLHHELTKDQDAVLTEVLPEESVATSWFASADGPHRNEVVIPLVRRGPGITGLSGSTTGTRGSSTARVARSPATVTVPPPRERARPTIRSQPREYLPGSEWLHASVYCCPERHSELLATRLPALAEAMPEAVDRWFFLRYHSCHDGGHHLRLRFHVTSTACVSEVVRRLSAFGDQLRQAGLTRRLVLDTYAPELERYGGAALMPDAERAFHADSVAVLEQLRLLRRGSVTIEPVVLAAVNHVGLTRAFWYGYGDTSAGGHGTGREPEPAWSRWLLESFVKDERAHRAFRRLRDDAMAVIDPYDPDLGWRTIPGGMVLGRSWTHRADAVAAYGRALRELGADSSVTPGHVLASLLHMHHNRLIGTDATSERFSYAVARAAVQAHHSRRAHTRQATDRVSR